MHTLDFGNGTVIHHNGDFSGNVVIDNGTHRMEIPFNHLKRLVAEWVRSERTAWLEAASSDELLGRRQL